VFEARQPSIQRGDQFLEPTNDGAAVSVQAGHRR
jgi:hypothetical protein